MFKMIFSLFNELIFTRSEEYDFKSKHFKPGKVIFVLVIVFISIYAFLMTSIVIRTGVKHMELTESHTILSEICAKPQTKPPATPAKNQSKGSSDSQKLSMEKQDD